MNDLKVTMDGFSTFLSKEVSVLFVFIFEADLSSLIWNYNVASVFNLVLSVFWIPIDDVDLDCAVCLGICSLLAEFYFFITLFSAEIFLVAYSIVCVIISILYPIGDLETFLI